MGAIDETFEVLGEKVAEINFLNEIEYVGEKLVHIIVTQSRNADFSEDELQTIKDELGAETYSIFPVQAGEGERERYGVEFVLERGERPEDD